MTETENLVLEQLRLMRKEIAEIKEGLAGVHVEIIDAQERRGLEKLRTEIEMDLARRHNWAAQELFWQHQAQRSGVRNYYIATAAIAALASIATTLIITKVF